MLESDLVFLSTSPNARGHWYEEGTLETLDKLAIDPIETSWSEEVLARGENDLDRQASKIKTGSLLNRQWKCLDDQYRYLHCCPSTAARLAKEQRARDLVRPFRRSKAKQLWRHWERQKQGSREAT